MGQSQFSKNFPCHGSVCDRTRVVGRLGSGMRVSASFQLGRSLYINWRMVVVVGGCRTPCKTGGELSGRGNVREKMFYTPMNAKLWTPRVQKHCFKFTLAVRSVTAKYQAAASDALETAREKLVDLQRRPSPKVLHTLFYTDYCFFHHH